MDLFAELQPAKLRGYMYSRPLFTCKVIAIVFILNIIFIFMVVFFKVFVSFVGTISIHAIAKNMNTTKFVTIAKIQL